MKTLLITPPLTQLNTPYPATLQLSQYLKSQNIDCTQSDLSIELINKILTHDAVREIFTLAENVKITGKKAINVRIILSNLDFYAKWVEPIKHFLQGKDNTYANLFARTNFWANQKKIANNSDLEWDYGIAGTWNRAQYLCTQFVADIATIVECINPHFELIRYGEKLCKNLPTFAPLDYELQQDENIIDRWMLELLDQKIEQHHPTHIGFSIPFPGNLYAALRCAKHIKNTKPEIKIIIGGGYINTELRSITDTKIFDYIDAITLDDGEIPLLNYITNKELIRTITCENGKIVNHNIDSCKNVVFAEQNDLNIEGLDYNLYLDTADTANPMQQLWSNGRWNKMMLAHGCYWAKCTFCDTTLDYIKRYETAPANVIADKMERIIDKTKTTGFHFVDEAAPPTILRNLAEEILQRKLAVSYWTNIRFEQAFTNELCFLMAQSGCIAVSGGIEVASQRILNLINKGISLKTLRSTLENFANNQIMVHAYLMYGFPTQTEKELYASLDYIRQLFAEGLLQSAFWHRYAMTCHSETGTQPEKFNTKITSKQNSFANNEIEYSCSNDPDWNKYQRGLNLATYNYMRGTGFDIDVKKWFK